MEELPDIGHTGEPHDIGPILYPKGRPPNRIEYALIAQAKPQLVATCAKATT